MPELEVYRPRRPSGLRRMWDAVRSIHLGPFNLKDAELARQFGYRPVSSGVSVSEESSLTFAGVWNAVVLVSGDVAKVPLPLYKLLPNGGKERFREHPLYELIHDEPNPEMSSFVFRRTLQGHVLVWGNGYAEIERDGAGRAVALWPLMPYAVSSFRDAGALKYRVRQPSGRDLVFDRRDVLHLSGLGLDGIDGYPPIRKAMESIGLGLATERFGATFFGNGATFGGIIKYPAGAASNQQARDDMRKALEKRHQGVDNAHRLLALYDGGEYQQLGVPPQHAQFLETRRFQIEEVARWFNIPVHKLKELARSTNNNIEHQGIEYATDTLQPWFRMWEGELRLKVIPRLERRQQFFEHITEALTRGDSAAQGSLVAQQFAVGGIAPNEVRAKFNYNPVPDGDDIYVPSNMMPAPIAKQYWKAQIEEITAKAEAAKRPPPAPVAPSPDPELKAENERIQRELDLARRAKQTAEDVADRAKQDQIGLRADLTREVETHEATGRALNTVTAQRDALAGELAGVRTDLATLTNVVTALAEERDGLKQRAEAAEAGQASEHGWRRSIEVDLEVAKGGWQIAKDTLIGAEAERDDLARRLAEAERAAVDLATERDEQIAKLTEARTDLVTRTADEQSARTERDMLSADVDTLQAEAQTLKAAADAATAAARTQRAMLLTAMRGLFVDAFERLLVREADRARKAQATPEKLRNWAETFYPLHADKVREALRPVVDAWATVAEDDSERLLEHLVTSHVAQSSQAIRQVADVDDPDQMAAALERTLRRWETERAGAVADGLIREGMTR